MGEAGAPDQYGRQPPVFLNRRRRRSGENTSGPQPDWRLYGSDDGVEVLFRVASSSAFQSGGVTPSRCLVKKS